ncbi:hypothetical protein GcC1_092016 [Golovinomyces cichoracearum]|uniref:Translation machinery-associated protein 17 n=1 Tax=Golovinomyces cichoracearum TaxID=62708 RepID=A0A420IE30_9PEZI|nr:hypothetical protein GcC1_092016 [Golovinomyces cichoracearum]
MSDQALPISLDRFKEALQSLPAQALQLKEAELQNSIAHLNYSNEQLKPFALGREESMNFQPDQDCIDALKENEIVIVRFRDRIELVRKELERRGINWSNFQADKESRRDIEDMNLSPNDSTNPNKLVSGNGKSNAWEDGTITTGRIVNGYLYQSPLESKKEHQTLDINNYHEDDEFRKIANDQKTESTGDEGIHL